METIFELIFTGLFFPVAFGLCYGIIKLIPENWLLKLANKIL